jgi:hypothetical protein
LQTARNINGVSFDGSANITVADSTKLPLAGGTMSGAITFAAGQTFPNAGIAYTKKTSAYTAVSNDGVIADTTAGPWTLTLPITPAAGAQVIISDGGAWGTNSLTVARNGSTIEGAAENLVLNVSGAQVQLIYDGTTWQVYAQVGGTGGDVVTLTATQTLTNKTLTSPVLTTPSLSGTVTGADGLLTRVILQDTGWDYFDSTTTAALDYVNGSVQRWAPTAASAPTLTIANWPPSGVMGELLIEGLNLGAAGTITFPTANWVKSDGTFAASPSAAGVTLQSSGTDFILIWTRDAGTTLYAKVIR